MRPWYSVVYRGGGGGESTREFTFRIPIYFVVHMYTRGTYICITKVPQQTGLIKSMPINNKIPPNMPPQAAAAVAVLQ